MKTIKSFIKLAAVTVAVVLMSGCLTSCDVIVDCMMDVPTRYDYRYDHAYNHRVYDHVTYYNYSPTPVSGSVVCGRR